MKHKLSIFALLILIIAFNTYPTSAQINSPRLSITTIPTENLQVVGSNGVRGAAAAVLDENQLLLGGGQKGSHLYLFNLSTKSDLLLGRVIPANERLNDARFAITDIAVLSKSESFANLLISYPSFRKNGNCVVVKLDAYQLTLGSKPTITKGKNWFTSKPCVPISAVQHAAGRLAVIDNKTTYLTVGDLGYSKIGNKRVRGDLGSVFKVSASKVEKISTGHRNQQGIELIGNDLYISEHGPRGGDELNLIKQGADYGWPTVTFGQAYSASDYIKPSKPGSHDGFELPLYNWVPSVAPTELVQLPNAGEWGAWSSQLVMATLKEQALIFIQLSNKNKVGQVAPVDVGERIRDLELLPDGRLAATTDSGNLLLISGGQ
jgi:glucose/arabinose dehydrogenase